MILTKDMLHSLAIDANEHNRFQGLGFTVPVIRCFIIKGFKKGWQRRLIGTEISDEKWKSAVQVAERERAKRATKKAASRNNWLNQRKPSRSRDYKPAHFARTRPWINFDPAYSPALRDEFLASRTWAELRYEALRKHGARCQCCGSTRHNGVVIQVDHVIPMAVDWSKHNDPSNLEVLCGPCNQGKGASFQDDWRNK